MSGAGLELFVTVAIITYRRPDDLAAAIPAVLAQIHGLTGPAELLIIDNDPDAGARRTVAGYPCVRYSHEPAPGIAAARNRALDEAADSDLLVFIDDDERPEPGWLEALLRTYRVDRPVAVVGPVRSRFEITPDPWLVAGGFFDRRQLATGTEVTVAATNNLLLDVRALRGLGIRFEVRLGLVGGSDNLFTRQLSRAGARILWCAEAAVVDVVPRGRLTRSWVLRRSFRMGNGTSLVEVELARTAGERLAARARQVLLGASRLAVGCGRFAAGTLARSIGLRAGGARNIARGLGLVTGAFGHAYAEYRRPVP